MIKTQPHALSLRVRGEICEDNGGARTCVGGINFNGGTNMCAGPAGQRVVSNGAVSHPLFNAATGTGQVQTAWEAPSHFNISRLRHS